MTQDEMISIARLAKKVDDMANEMVTKDLLRAEISRIDTAIESHIKYTRDAAAAETARINEILKTNADALKQSNTEASESKASAARQTEDVAKTLREVVESTRSANAKAQAELINPIIARLDEIQQRQYENKGIDSVKDPMMIKLVERMEIVATAMAESKGKGAGATAMWGYIIGAVGLISAILAIASRYVK